MFAVAILADLSLSMREAMWLFGLFWAQFIIGAVVPESAHGAELTIVSVVYLGSPRASWCATGAASGCCS